MEISFYHDRDSHFFFSGEENYVVHNFPDTYFFLRPVPAFIYDQDMKIYRGALTWLRCFDTEKRNINIKCV